MFAVSSMDFGRIAGDFRRARKIRQLDLARRAGVSRQWIVALEQGKPTLELGLVLRTLETLGLEIDLKPFDPPPAWTIALHREAQAKAYAIQARRRRTSRDRSRSLQWRKECA